MRFFVVKKTPALLCGIFITAVVVATAVADDTKDLSERLQKYHTLAGRFSQTLIDARGELIQDSKGVFTVKKPGYFRWETQEPFPRLLVADLQTVWLYDPDLEQVTIRPYTDSVAQSPALLLSGNTTEIAGVYDVVKAEENDSLFILTPKNEEVGFTELRLQFGAGKLASMQLVDSLQQTTTFVFSDLKININVPATEFWFTPPEGVDVLIDR